MTCCASVLLLGYSSSFIKKTKIGISALTALQSLMKLEKGGEPVLKRDLVSLQVVIQ